MFITNTKEHIEKLQAEMEGIKSELGFVIDMLGFDLYGYGADGCAKSVEAAIKTFEEINTFLEMIKEESK